MKHDLHLSQQVLAHCPFSFASDISRLTVAEVRKRCTKSLEGGFTAGGRSMGPLAHCRPDKNNRRRIKLCIETLS
eukprot:4833302-Pleurochrysis_carterae.AAC.1